MSKKTKTMQEVNIENYTRKPLEAVMFLDKACVSIPESCEEVWIFRGSKQYKFNLT